MPTENPETEPMPKERIIVEPKMPTCNANLILTEEQQSLVDNFQWVEEDEECTSTTMLPADDAATDILICVESVAEHLMKSVSPEHYTSGVFSIPIDPSLHRVFENRYNMDYNEESRLRVFKLVKYALEGTLMNDPYKEQVEHAFDDVLKSRDSVCKIKEAKLHEEPPFVMDGEVTPASLSIEVYIDFEDCEKDRKAAEAAEAVDPNVEIQSKAMDLTMQFMAFIDEVTKKIDKAADELIEKTDRSSED